MRCRLFHALVEISLVLCFALAAMWVRSYWRHYSFYYWSAHPNARQTLVDVSSDGGHVLFQLESRSCENSPPREARRLLLPPGFHRSSTPATDLWQRFSQHPIYLPRSTLGVTYVWRFPIRGTPIVTTLVGFSYAWPLALAALFPGTALARIAVGRIQRADRRRHHRCEFCNYSLFHNTSGVCPECGNALREVAPAE